MQRDKKDWFIAGVNRAKYAFDIRLPQSDWAGTGTYRATILNLVMKLVISVHMMWAVNIWSGG